MYGCGARSSAGYRIRRSDNSGFCDVLCFDPRLNHYRGCRGRNARYHLGTRQLVRAKAQGFAYIEWDNADAYTSDDLLGVIEISRAFGLRVVVKNPELIADGADAVVSHPNVHGIIVEKDAGTPESMDRLRTRVGRPMLPVWFVGFDKDGREWAEKIATDAKNYANVGVTISTNGEYGNAVHIARPWHVAIETQLTQNRWR